VQYAVVGNRAVFEGDIVLGTVDELVSRSAELDSASLATGPSRAVVVVVVVGAQYRWSNALMPYAISAALPNATRVTAAQYPNWVEVIVSDGCWSQVGMRGGGRRSVLPAAAGSAQPFSTG